MPDIKVMIMNQGLSISDLIHSFPADYLNFDLTSLRSQLVSITHQMKRL